ncbi:MAG TPA: hypothetical protein VKB05_15490 [Pyrinomonadaceae bacterium]|nr:hypothetical protein [Pyrinomonadaceae bacterium]
MGMDIITEARGALARAYTHPENESKVLDADLIEAMVEELTPFLRSRNSSYVSVRNLRCPITLWSISGSWCWISTAEFMR